MRRCESGLFDILKIIFRVPIEAQFSDGDKWVIRMRPNLRDIEDIPFVIEALIEGHDLDVEAPSSTVPLRDMFKEVLGRIIRVCGLEFFGFLACKILNTHIRFEMIFHPKRLSRFIHPLVCMRPVPIHMSEPIRGPSIRK